MHLRSLSVSARRSFAISLLGKTKNSVKSDFWTWIYALRRGFEDAFFGLVQRRVQYHSVCCLGCADFSRKMSDNSEAAMGGMARELYVLICYMCAPCRHKEGHQECTRDLNFQYCINWSDIEWSLHESNLQQKGKKRQKKLDKMQRQSLQKTPLQLALKIQRTRQQRNRRWKILEVRSSLLTRVLSKRIAFPWDRTHEASPAPAKRLKRDDDRGHEDQNRPSDRGQDDSHQERHSHKWSSSSLSSNGSSAGSGPSRSRRLAESQADLPAGVGSSGNWIAAEEGPAGIDSSWSRTTAERSPAGVGSFRNWTTAGEGPAEASSSRSSTTMDRPAGVGFLRVADYRRQTL